MTRNTVWAQTSGLEVRVVRICWTRYSPYSGGAAGCSHSASGEMIHDTEGSWPDLTSAANEAGRGKQLIDVRVRAGGGPTKSPRRHRRGLQWWVPRRALLAGGGGAGAGAVPAVPVAAESAGGGSGGSPGGAHGGYRTRGNGRRRLLRRGGVGRAAVGRPHAGRGRALRGCRALRRLGRGAAASAERGAGAGPVPHGGTDRLAGAQLEHRDDDQRDDEHHGRAGPGPHPGRAVSEEAPDAAGLAVPPVARAATRSGITGTGTTGAPVHHGPVAHPHRAVAGVVVAGSVGLVVLGRGRVRDVPRLAEVLPGGLARVSVLAGRVQVLAGDVGTPARLGPGGLGPARRGQAGLLPVRGGVARTVPVAAGRTVHPGGVAAADRVGPGRIGPGHAAVVGGVRVGLRAGGGPLARVLDDDRGDLFLGPGQVVLVDGETSGAGPAADRGAQNRSAVAEITRQDGAGHGRGHA